jgi:hypothetical protein
MVGFIYGTWCFSSEGQIEGLVVASLWGSSTVVGVSVVRDRVRVWWWLYGGFHLQ